MNAPILRNDLRREYRTRYGISVVVMFLFITVTTIAFSAPGEVLSSGVMSAFFWIALFFGAMTGLARSFVSEEENGTSFLLRLYASSEQVFWGKFIFNLLLVLLLAVSAIVIFIFFFKDFTVKDMWAFLFVTITGCFGTASVITILSSLVARSHQKGALLPLVVLPVLMPLVISVTDATRITLEVPNAWEGISGDILVIVSFGIALTLVSYVLFDTIWCD